MFEKCVDRCAAECEGKNLPQCEVIQDMHCIICNKIYYDHENTKPCLSGDNVVFIQLASLDEGGHLIGCSVVYGDCIYELGKYVTYYKNCLKNLKTQNNTEVNHEYYPS